MVAKFGSAHPIGQAAAASLNSSGNQSMVTQAQAGVAAGTESRHQLTLDAAEETPGGAVGIDAINAASRSLTCKAQATLSLAGKSRLRTSSLSLLEAPYRPCRVFRLGFVPLAAPTSPTGFPESTSGDRRSTLGEYPNHTSVASPCGVSLSPEHVEAGLDAA